jgi:hypothetical protein
MPLSLASPDGPATGERRERPVPEPAHAFCGSPRYLGTPGGTGRQIGATPTLYPLGINLRSGRVEAR